MSTGSISAAAYKDTKPHYEILDGLRGIAAFIVIIYHVFECFSSTPLPHGYLAVDFFFVLSGFVIGYAYDNRWDKMTTGGFFRRRLIRLHPMVIMGCIIGVITFLIQGSVKWDGSSVGLSLVMLAMLSSLAVWSADVDQAQIGGIWYAFDNNPYNQPDYQKSF